MLQVQRKYGYTSPYRVAELFADLSDKQQAFEWLKIAYREHDTFRLIALKPDFMLDSLRSDPRYVDVLRRIGLPK